MSNLVVRLLDRSSRRASQFNVNVIGVIFTINAFLPLLKRGTTKKVITISSAVGDPEFVRAAKGVDSDAPYAISKAAVNLANAKYAVEYEDEGFTFVALSPGLVNTSTGSRKWESLFRGWVLAHAPSARVSHRCRC